MIYKKRVVFLLFLLTLSRYVHGTHGFFATGYGTKALGMGGVATAYAQDSLVAATNPAGMYWIGSRVDIGAQLFMPIRRYSYSTDEEGHKAKSQRNYFIIPHLGASYNNLPLKNSSLGVSIYGYGGINTQYPKSNPTFGHGKLGVSAEILVVAPTFAYVFLKKQSLGASILLGGQKIKLYGLQNLRAASSSPSYVSNNGYNFAAGGGVRVGWLGQFGSHIWLGAAYSTKIYMAKPMFKYRGIFADHGKFNVPANFSVGVRYKIIDPMNFAFDFQRIFYKDIRAIGNSVSLFSPGTLGEKNGAGFGWHNLSVYKFGLDFNLKTIIMRAGYAYSRVPYSSKQIDFNIIAPAVVKHHITVGASVTIQEHHEIDVAYFHAYGNTIAGQSRFGLGQVKHHMFQNGIEINYGLKF